MPAVSKPYDYIVVGAGSAGCVVASRLSEDPQVRVLLLESGGPDRHPFMKVPAAFYELLKVKRLAWNYTSEVEPDAARRTFPLQRGKVVGGTGAVNGMTYSRGAPADYDDWVRAGGDGWGYANVLPYFKRAESNWRGETAYHGGAGPISVTRANTDRDAFYPAMMQAALATGGKLNDDICGADCEGFARVEFTIHHGRRASTSQRYLQPALARANLDVVANATVHRILLEGSRAVGIEYDRRGTVHQVRCEREVILSAGAYNSPQLLMLSGIGPADALRAAGVPARHDLPGVGSNLQDHAVIALAYGASQPVTFHRELRLDRLAISALRWQLFGTGPLAQLPLTCWAFRKTQPALPCADVQFFFSPVSINATPWFPGLRKGAGHIVTARNALRYPMSRGSVRLASADPRAAPRILSNLLQDERDVSSLARAVEQTRELMATAPLSDLIDRELAPSAGRTSHREVLDFVRENARPACHPSCTCAMGDGPDAVVDPQLRVRGIEGLRVVDASVMPSIVGGNLNAPTIMIGEKAVDLILGRSISH
jgi:choline dehydrogenase